MTLTITQTIRPYDVEVARNYVLNPRLEAGVSGWSAINATTVDESTTRARSGIQSLIVTARSASTDDFGQLVVPVPEPGQYTVSFYVWLLSAGSTYNSRGILAVASGTGAISGQASYDGSKLNQWQRVSCVVTVGAGGANISIRAYAMTGNNIWVDDVMVTAGSTLLNYFDGSTSDTVTDQYVWAGPVNASQSIKYQRSPASAPLTPQLLLTESFNMEAEVRSQVHPLLGGVPDDVDLEAAGPRRGTLQLLFTDQAEAIRGFEMHRNASLFELDDPDFGEMTYVPQGTLRLTLDPVTLTAMVLETGFTEVAA